MDPHPDLTTLSDDDLRVMIRDLEKEEDEVSFQRRMLHGRIDILRAELVARLREQVSAGEAKLADVGPAQRDPVREGISEGRRRVSHVYCPECGFQNPETSNYCSRCGALIVPETGSETTMTFDVDEAGEEGESLLETLGITGPALVVRSGGGIAGQPFQPTGALTLVGRSPECDIFLDDVTVSRRHAEIAREGDTFTIRDLGSLNGTYVNRKRIESTVLEDDDEVQIGKYRLTFLQR